MYYSGIVMKIKCFYLTKSNPGSGGPSLLSQHLGGRGRQISELEASLVYRVSSRTARATQRNPVWKKNKTKQTNKQTNKNPFIHILLFVCLFVCIYIM